MRSPAIGIATALFLTIAVVWWWTQRAPQNAGQEQPVPAAASRAQARTWADIIDNVEAIRIFPEQLEMGMAANGVRKWFRNSVRVDNPLVLEDMLAYQPTSMPPIALTASQRARWKTILSDGSQPHPVPSRCIFSPGVVYRCYGAAHRVCDVVVCFHCKEWQILEGYGGEPCSFDPIADELLKLTRELFPDDEELAAVRLR